MSQALIPIKSIMIFVDIYHDIRPLENQIQPYDWCKNWYYQTKPFFASPFLQSSKYSLFHPIIKLWQLLSTVIKTNTPCSNSITIVLKLIAHLNDNLINTSFMYKNAIHKRVLIKFYICYCKNLTMHNSLIFIITKCFLIWQISTRNR